MSTYKLLLREARSQKNKNKNKNNKKKHQKGIKKQDKPKAYLKNSVIISVIVQFHTVFIIESIIK